MAYVFWHSIRHSFWHIFWHSFWHLLRHTLWHLFWHCMWHSIWHLFWHSLSGICHKFWHSIWQSFWHCVWHFLWHVFGSRRGPQHPNLARSHSIQSWRCGGQVQACTGASGAGRGDQDNKEAEGEEVKEEGHNCGVRIPTDGACYDGYTVLCPWR